MTPADAAGLSPLSLDALRQIWRQRLKTDPPAHQSRDLLLRSLIYRLEARSRGEPARKLCRRLDELAQRFATDPSYAPPTASPFRPGAVLVREWNGVRHIVTITDGGVIYEGRTYSSLSAVAKTITGTKWSGPRFFNLTETNEAKSP